MSNPGTKVNVPPPPKSNRMQFLQNLGETVAEPAPSNLAEPSTTRPADMNFKVSEEFHRAFKTASVVKGISMKELLEEAFGLWLQANKDLGLQTGVSAGVAQTRSRGRSRRGERA